MGWAGKMARDGYQNLTAAVAQPLVNYRRRQLSQCLASPLPHFQTEGFGLQLSHFPYEAFTTDLLKKTGAGRRDSGPLSNFQPEQIFYFVFQRDVAAS